MSDFNLISHLHRQRAFSIETFGPSQNTNGVIDHIRKELIRRAYRAGYKGVSLETKDSLRAAQSLYDKNIGYIFRATEVPRFYLEPHERLIINAVLSAVSSVKEKDHE